MKRLVDLFLGTTLLLAALPFMAAMALLLALFERGSFLFSQVRLGKGGRLFRCYKFRTMHDGHVTRIGKILRRTSLDELPQLWNVLRGEMSLVGPRPYLPQEASPWSPPFPLILSVLPGLTGLWQVRGRKALSFDQRLHYDAEYVIRRTTRLDLRLLVATIPSIVSGRGAY